MCGGTLDRRGFRTSARRRFVRRWRPRASGTAGSRPWAVGGRGPRKKTHSTSADYMMTELFQEAVTRLLALAAEQPTAVMCAEKLYWKCHRRLLSDYLVAQGVTVEHILGQNELRPHCMTPGATVTDERTIIYR